MPLARPRARVRPRPLTPKDLRRQRLAAATPLPQSPSVGSRTGTPLDARLPPITPAPLATGTRVEVRSRLRRPEVTDGSRSLYYRGRVLGRNAAATRYEILYDDGLVEKGVTDSFVRVLAPPPEVEARGGRLDMLEQGVLYQKRLDVVAVNRMQRRVRQRLEASGHLPADAAEDDEFVSGALSQLWYSAREIQRTWRGYRARLAVWAPGGPGWRHMALRVQKTFRGYLGRKEAWRRRNARLMRARETLLALFLGKQGRKVAARARARRVVRATVNIQRVFRGLCGRKRFRAVRYALHTACATVIQKIVRGMLGKLAIEHLHERLQGEQRWLTMRGIFLSTLRRHNRYYPPAIVPQEREPLLDLAFTAMCELQQYELAWTLFETALGLFPESPRVLYGYCMLLTITVRDLGRAWRLRERARRFDPKGECFEDIERRFFVTALRLHPRNANAYLHMAVMIQTLWGPQMTRPKSLAGRIFRAVLYYGHAMELDPTNNKPAIGRNRVMFLSTYTKPSEVVVALPRVLRDVEYRFTLSRQGVLLRLDAFEVQSPDVALEPLLFFTSDIEYLFRLEEQQLRARQRADATVKLEDSSIFDATMGTGLEAKGERSVNALSESMALRLIKGVVLLRGYDSLDDEHVMQLVVHKMAALRDRRRRERARQTAAGTIQRVFRGFQGRSHWRRTRERELHKQRQADFLWQRLDASRAIRTMRYAVVSNIQAMWRGYTVRGILRLWRRCVTLIQARYRGYRYRRMRWEAEKRRLEGPAVLLMYQRGIVISGIYMVLRAYRCGNSYKFIGTELTSCETYFGFLPHSVVQHILDETQLSPEEEEQQLLLGKRDRSAEKPVRIWQHERVLHFLLSILAAVDHIAPLTHDLFKVDRFKVLVADPVLRSAARGEGVLAVGHQHRLLKDQLTALVRYRENGDMLEEVSQLAEVRKKGWNTSPTSKGARK